MEIANSSVGLFNFAVDCIGRIQLARDFEADFTTYQLKLDVVQIRLSRWGELAGVDTSVGMAPSVALQIIEAEEDEEYVNADPVKRAQKLIYDIHGLLLSTKRNAAKMKDKLEAGSDQTLDVASHMPSDLKAIRKKFQRCLGRRATKCAESIKWAFYKREQFEKFVSDLSALVDALEHVFPEDTREKLHELSKQECKDLSKANLEELKEIVKDCDPWLDGAVDEELQHVPGGNSYYINQSNVQGTATGIHNGNSQQNNYWGSTADIAAKGGHTA